MSEFRAGFEDFRTVRIEARIPTDPGELFVWKAQTSRGWHREAMLATKVGGRVRVAWVQTAYPAEEVIRDTLNALSSASLTQDEARDVPKRAFALALNATGAALEFDGQYAELDIDKAGSAEPAPVRLYHEARAACANRPTEVLSYYSPLSAQSLRETWGITKENQFQTICNEITSKPKRLKFLIDADPVFLLFLAPARTSAWDSSNVDIKYVVRTETGFQIANTGFLGLFESLFYYSDQLPRFLKLIDSHKTPAKASQGNAAGG